MSCEKWLPLIEEYLDDELDESSIKRLRAHMADCRQCAHEYEQLRREQNLYQSYIRDIEVTPALWASVQSRIQQDGAGPGIFERTRRLASTLGAGPRLSPVYAVLLVILAVAVTVIVMRRPGPSSGTLPGTPGSSDNSNIATATATPAQSPTPTPSPGAGAQPNPEREHYIARNDVNKPSRSGVKPAQPQTAEQAVREAEQKYVAAIAILSRDVSKHRSELDPAVAAKFEATLASIDFTIRETKRAVREHPNDPVAAQYMLAAYSEKLDVLREMAGQ